MFGAQTVPVLWRLIPGTETPIDLIGDEAWYFFTCSPINAPTSEPFRQPNDTDSFVNSVPDSENNAVAILLPPRSIPSMDISLLLFKINIKSLQQLVDSNQAVSVVF